MHADHAQESSHDRHGPLATRTVKVCALASPHVRCVQPHGGGLVARVRAAARSRPDRSSRERPCPRSVRIRRPYHRSCDSVHRQRVRAARCPRGRWKALSKVDTARWRIPAEGEEDTFTSHLRTRPWLWHFGAAVGRITGRARTSVTLPARSLALAERAKSFLLISASLRPETSDRISPCTEQVGPPVSLY